MILVKILFKSKKLERECREYNITKRKYGQNAEKIHQRLGELEVLENLQIGLQFEIGGLHPLKGDREGQYVMSLNHPHRLILIEECAEQSTVRILEIVDYH